MSEIMDARNTLVARILKGSGYSSRALRRAAFENAGLVEPLKTLIDKVARHPHSVTDWDVSAVRASGLSEDEIFELVVCAAVGQAVFQHDNALVVLGRATGRK